jgi:hypothetical protein
LQDSIISSRNQNFRKNKKITSFHPSKCIVMITIILNFIYLFTWALHCCALLVTINQSFDEKNELILWKLSSIWMKILNDIACNLNLILIQFQLNSNTLNEISIVSIQLNSIPINSNTLNKI